MSSNARTPNIGTSKTSILGIDRQKIANRNLWVSIPNLLCGFSVWLYWGMIAKIMQRLHFANPELFNFTFGTTACRTTRPGYRALLFTLPAVAGLAGATLRIPNSFMIAICGGRNVKFMTTVLLIIPAVAGRHRPAESQDAVLRLHRPGRPVGRGRWRVCFQHVEYLVLLSQTHARIGVGPERGLGNAGVSVMQFLIPWVITFGLFGALGGDPQGIVADGNTQQVWIQNAALIWVPVMTVLAVVACCLMNNLPQHQCGPTPVAIGKYLWLQMLGFLGAGVVSCCCCSSSLPIPELVRIFVVLVASVVVTLLLMRFLTPRPFKEAYKPVRHLRQQAQLGHDLALHDDLRLVHRLCQRVSETD